MTFEPQAFEKGDDQRVATTPEAAVALKFKGYREIKSDAVDGDAPEQSNADAPPAGGPEFPEPDSLLESDEAADDDADPEDSGEESDDGAAGTAYTF